MSSGLKEDPKGSQVAKSQRGVSKMRFLIFLGLLLPNQHLCQQAAYA